MYFCTNDNNTHPPSLSLSFPGQQARDASKGTTSWYRKPVPSNFYDLSVMDVGDGDLADALTRVDVSCAWLSSLLGVPAAASLVALFSVLVC